MSESIRAALQEYYGGLSEAFSDIITNPLIFADHDHGEEPRNKALRALNSVISGLHGLALELEKMLPRHCRKRGHTLSPPNKYKGITPKETSAFIKGRKSASDIAQEHVADFVID